MDDLSEARRATLRHFVVKNGGNAAVGRTFGLSRSDVSYLGQLISPTSTRKIGDYSAQKWERLLQLEGHPLMYPSPVAAEDEAPATLSVAEVFRALHPLLNAVPNDKREAIASLLGVYARDPTDEVKDALITFVTVLTAGQAAEE